MATRKPMTIYEDDGQKRYLERNAQAGKQSISSGSPANKIQLKLKTKSAISSRFLVILDDDDLAGCYVAVR